MTARALRSVTLPSAVAATAARSACRRRSPSRSTSPSTAGPAASAAAKVSDGSFGRERRRTRRARRPSPAPGSGARPARRGPSGRAASAARASFRPRYASASALRHRSRRRATCVGVVPDPERDRVAGELDRVACDSAGPRRSAPGPGDFGCEANGRPVSRSMACRRGRSRAASARRRRRRRRARQGGDGPRVADPAQGRRPRRRRAAGFGAVERRDQGGTAERSSRPMFRTIRARSSGESAGCSSAWTRAGTA